MAKKIDSKKVKRNLKSGLNFSKFYFSKSTSVVLITSYSVVLFLAFAVLGFSSLISAPNSDDNIPSLPEKEPFAFLPADNLEVPVLGEVEPEKEPEKETKKEPEKPVEEIKSEPAVSQPAVAETPVIASREVVRTVEKEVVKEVPKEVVKVVEKEVVKEVPVEKPAEQELEYYDNYAAPETAPIGDFTEYKNFPDKVEEVSKEDETNSEQ